MVHLHLTTAVAAAGEPNCCNVESSGSRWYNYLTPPRRSSFRQKRRLGLSPSVTKGELPVTLSPPPILQTASDDTMSSPLLLGQQFLSGSINQSLSPRTGLFRRFQHRRARRLAEYEAAVTNLRYLKELPSPPNSGNCFANSTKRAMRCIPADHPLKLFWDVATIAISLVNAYITHMAIRDRNFDTFNAFKVLTEMWFVTDILLNFVTERKIGNVTLRTVSAASARYLTTWFVIDVLSLVPGELLFVQPVIKQQKARGFLRKWLMRGRAVTRVSGKLLQRWNIVRSFGVAYKQRAGIGGIARLIRCLIKYIPKYLLFFRHMKAVVWFRVLRQVHWMRKIYHNFIVAIHVDQKHEVADGVLDDDMTNSSTNFSFDDFDMDLNEDGNDEEHILDEEPHVVLFDDDDFFFVFDDDDDGDPY